ncbi:MAG: U32 family peptidase [Spirochaetales bacterium]|nr:U32 family peptidase [Spirochaetales bacterium]
MELLSPAGSIEKLKYAWLYGADAAYIGLQGFSLRAKADNFANEPLSAEEEAAYIKSIKGDKKLYCALNIYFHNKDINRLERNLDAFAAYPFDAFIISDIGLVPLLRRKFPGTELHLSTQANATNGEAVKMYGDMGFSRVVLGREVSLAEIEAIKKAAPHIEIEAFVHGAMCLAYSGRCFLSAWMTGRSGNDGTCAHSCRWDYRVLEEEKRPGEYYPVIENEGFTSILSSKDICMIDYLKEMGDAGVDSLKIEGRMKSIYYTAVVTRAYRKALDRLAGKDIPDYQGYRDELEKVSHREFSTGFYFGREEIEKSTEISYQRQYIFMGSLGKELSPGRFELDIKNKIRRGDELEFIGPDELYLSDRDWKILDGCGEEPEEADHGKKYEIIPGVPAAEGYIIRKKKE